jgi:hypothetical protein
MRWLIPPVLSRRRYELISFLLPLVVYGLTLRENFADTHSLNVLTQYALWTTGSPSLGPVSHPIIPDWSGFNAQVNIDLIISKGQYFSVYAPGLSYLSYPFGALGFLLNHGGLGIQSWAILTDEGFVALCGAISALVLYKICRMYATPRSSLLASLTLAFGTLVWPFATEIFDHDVAMLFSLLGVYCVMRFSRTEGTGREKYALLAAGGASLGVGYTIEYLSALLILPLALFLIFKRKLNLPLGAVLFATFLIGPLLDLAYNQSVTGSFLTFPEDVWNGSTALSRFVPSQLLAIPFFNLLSPYRGLLLYSPVLFVGIYGLYRMYCSARFRGDAVLFLSLFLFGLIPYSAWSPWDGGYSFGPRFLVDVIPYLVIPIAFVLSEVRGRFDRGRDLIFLSLFFLSSLIAGVGAFTEASTPNGTDILSIQPITQSFSWVLQNHLDSWWHRLSPEITLAVVPACFILIWGVSVRFVASKGESTEEGVNPGGRRSTS